MSPAELNEQLNLPRPPGAFRRVMRAHPRWVDGTIAGFYLLGTAGIAVADQVISVEVPEMAAPDYLQLPRLLLLVLVWVAAFRPF